jgi:hypothetical protein
VVVAPTTTTTRLHKRWKELAMLTAWQDTGVGNAAHGWGRRSMMTALDDVTQQNILFIE